MVGLQELGGATAAGRGAEASGLCSALCHDVTDSRAHLPGAAGCSTSKFQQRRGTWRRRRMVDRETSRRRQRTY
jgi:hypothetical protein